MRCSIILQLFAMVCLALTLTASHLSAKSPPQAGDSVEDVLTFNFPIPTVEEHRVHLNLADGRETVSLKDMGKAYLLVEIVGVYCPVCHNQAPQVLRLYQRVQRDPGLADKLGMVAIAAGATPMEVEHLHRTWRFPFPILQDGDYALHKLVGEPDTPFAFIVDRDGVVLYARVGRIDPDNLFNQLTKLP